VQALLGGDDVAVYYRGEALPKVDRPRRLILRLVLGLTRNLVTIQYRRFSQHAHPAAGGVQGCPCLVSCT
jgi:hypothetical protein